MSSGRRPVEDQPSRRSPSLKSRRDRSTPKHPPPQKAHWDDEPLPLENDGDGVGEFFSSRAIHRPHGEDKTEVIPTELILQKIARHRPPPHPSDSLDHDSPETSLVRTVRAPSRARDTPVRDSRYSPRATRNAPPRDAEADSMTFAPHANRSPREVESRVAGATIDLSRIGSGQIHRYRPANRTPGASTGLNGSAGEDGDRKMNISS